MEIPRANLPKALDIPQLYLVQPSARVPSYKPMVIPPADLERPAETQAEETTEQPIVEGKGYTWKESTRSWVEIPVALPMSD